MGPSSQKKEPSIDIIGWGASHTGSHLRPRGMFRDTFNSPAESGLAAKMAVMAEIATLFSTVVIARGAFRYAAGWR